MDPDSDSNTSSPSGDTNRPLGSMRQKVIQPLDPTLQAPRIQVATIRPASPQADSVTQTPPNQPDSYVSDVVSSPVVGGLSIDPGGKSESTDSTPPVVKQPFSEVPVPKILNTEQYPIPWLKIAALGFFTPIVLSALLYIVIVLAIKLFGGAVFITLALNGFVPFILMIVLGGGFYFVNRKLQRWTIIRPLLISFGTVVLMVLSYYVVQRAGRYGFVNELFTGDAGTAQTFASYASALVAPLSGMIGLLAGTYLFNVAVTRPIRFRYAIFALIILLPLLGFLYDPRPVGSLHAETYGKNSSDGVYLPNIQDLDWTLLPAKLPAGVAGLEECKLTPVSYYAGCALEYSEWPGYLSAEGQARAAAFISERKLRPETHIGQDYVRIEMSPYDKRFERYFYKNGSCDIIGLTSLMHVAPEYRDKSQKDDTFDSTGKCFKQTTPGGMTVYGEMHTVAGISYPWQYYFVKDGTVVMLQHTGNSIYENYLQVLYISDSNYRSQFDAMVDSFSKDIPKTDGKIGSSKLVGSTIEVDAVKYAYTVSGLRQPEASSTKDDSRVVGKDAVSGKTVALSVNMITGEPKPCSQVPAYIQVQSVGTVTINGQLVELCYFENNEYYANVSVSNYNYKIAVQPEIDSAGSRGGDIGVDVAKRVIESVTIR